MKKTQDKEFLKVRINCTIQGEPATVLLELKKEESSLQTVKPSLEDWKYSISKSLKGT